MIIEKDILNATIEGHRQLIGERYEYDRIQSIYELQPSFTRDKLEPLRRFFLEYVYPDIEKRNELDDAFAKLDNHVRHPGQLLRILADSASIIFHHGRHLPKILSAGIKALKSFRTASNVENMIALKAIENGASPPFTNQDIQVLMSELPRNELDKLVDDSMALYEILFNKKLVSKIIAVVDELIDKMESRPSVYDVKEVDGIKLGRTLITEGMKLFGQFSNTDQRHLVTLITTIERDSIKELDELSNT